MRPVFCVPRLSDSPASPEAPNSPMMGSPMEVFSLEEEVRGGKTPVPFEQSAAAAAEALHQLERLLAPSSDAEAMLARHVELAAGGAHRVDCAALCAVLQRLGYSAKLHESTASLYSFKQGVRHQYITVCLPDTSRAGLSTVVVEPNFRDCFCIAHPTPRFEALLDGTPSAVVASKAAMHRAVGILAREMARSFSDRGEELPPWRTPQALLSKWQLGSGSAAAATGAGCSAWAAQGYPAAAGNLFATKHHAAFGAA